MSRRVRYCSAHHMLMDAKARALDAGAALHRNAQDDGEPVQIERDELGFIKARTMDLGSPRSRRPAWARRDHVVSAERGALPHGALSVPESNKARPERRDSHRDHGRSDAKRRLGTPWLDCFRRAGLRGSFTVVLVGPELSPQDPTEAWKETRWTRRRSTCVRRRRTF